MGMMPMTLLAYDQASKFSEYSAALPVTKEQLVGSKYIVGLCGLVLAELFAAAALGVAQPALDSCGPVRLWFPRWCR